MKEAQVKNDRQRKGLLAKIHIAKAALALDDDTYREVLAAEFRGKRSAADLSVLQMEQLLSIFKAWGWKAHPDKQVKALRARARELAAELPDHEKRLKGLVKKICRVERLEWCRDIEALRRLLAALKKIVDGYSEIKTGGK